MSVKLLDGPAKGEYSVTRAPYFLRAVIDATGKCDLLDHLGDTPTPTETIHVYRCEPGSPLVDQDGFRRMGIYLCGRDGHRMGATARYVHRADVDGETLRTTEAWREWCRAQPADRPLIDVAAPLSPRNAGE